MDELPADGYTPHPMLWFSDYQFGLFIFDALGTCLIKLNCTVAEDAEAEMETIQECDNVPDDIPNDDPFTQEQPREQTEDCFGPQDSHDHKHQDKSDEDNDPGSQESQEEFKSASNFGHEKMQVIGMTVTG